MRGRGIEKRQRKDGLRLVVKQTWNRCWSGEGGCWKRGGVHDRTQASLVWPQQVVVGVVVAIGNVEVAFVVVVVVVVIVSPSKWTTILTSFLALVGQIG